MLRKAALALRGGNKEEDRHPVTSWSSPIQSPSAPMDSRLLTVNLKVTAHMSVRTTNKNIVFSDVLLACTDIMDTYDGPMETLGFYWIMILVLVKRLKSLRGNEGTQDFVSSVSEPISFLTDISSPYLKTFPTTAFSFGREFRAGKVSGNASVSFSETRAVTTSLELILQSLGLVNDHLGSALSALKIPAERIKGSLVIHMALRDSFSHIQPATLKETSD
ncbi:matrix protein [Lepeophtheirus salmonis rhabdovirus 127]|uniref:Matrix protein n=1 Tax=Lepeophtheirus salmonis rhabdovirus 127 TaxID=1573761 RepID=A0A0A1E8V2_9RHAB|nr:matrix protein [Lepeophtheirus salmonis rhabdovirus 127]AIY25914.1 matrix protein [Lepeophtheirus salmonis rhabdovirus 127]